MKAGLPFLFSLLFAAVAQAGGLTFESASQEATAELEQTEVIVDFPFSNESDTAVTIQRYEAACSCTSVKVKGGKMRYEPGEKGLIRTVFDLGTFVGDTSKSIQLWVDDDPATRPSVVLQAKIHIPVLVSLEPKTLRWEPNDALSPKTITVTMSHSEPIHVSKVACGNESFHTQIKTIEDGKLYEIEVTPVSTEKPALGIISIETDCKVARHATQRAFAMIRKMPQLPTKSGS
ncbi:hypothetical protein HNR46_003789 [Haloferula luteola]|uniref:DUF1573 domain-containing protein n=1 Tax=Haloferula luteola TaxID=595692 RepID=A0A840VG02_9BACT|nr:DUF1573 domain-containing protein [Haloferula luteola]MBB5353528.1 hypothetical protein [Haloferula luteola]